jgi:pimeloyl-ACP methyl ester carboxylesterase
MSMGGAIALQTADRSELADKVSALVLDDPAVDWRDVLRHQGEERHVPSMLASLAGWVAEKRTGISLDRLDWVARAEDLRKPTLIFAGPDDDFIPWQPARDLAAARPDLVRLVEFKQAGHVRNWNVDAGRYERELTAFLARHR